MVRVRIDYFDQNESFARCLPRTGEVRGQYSSTEGADNWFLVHLDELISYQLEAPTPPKWELIETEYLLIRSRWLGKDIGAAEPVSVFLLLVRPSQLPLTGPLKIESYIHAAWGMCSALNVAA